MLTVETYIEGGHDDDSADHKREQDTVKQSEGIKDDRSYFVILL